MYEGLINMVVEYTQCRNRAINALHLFNYDVVRY